MIDAAQRRKLWLLLALVLSIGGFFAFGLQRQLSLSSLRDHHAALMQWVSVHPLLAPLAFVALFMGLGALTLPTNIPAAVAAGALFGLGEGVLLAAFASAIGGTLSFLSSRYVLRDFVRRRLGRWLVEMEAGMAGGELVYLLSLRLTPVMPYVLVNLVFGVGRMSAWRFYAVSQIGILPAVAVYAHAGTELDQIKGLSDVLSPEMLVSLLLLATLPLLARAVVKRLRRG